METAAPERAETRRMNPHMVIPLQALNRVLYNQDYINQFIREAQETKMFVNDVERLCGPHGLVMIDGYNPNGAFYKNPKSLKLTEKIGIKPLSVKDELITIKYPTIAALLQSPKSQTRFVTWGNTARLSQAMINGKPIRDYSKRKVGDTLSQVVSQFPRHYLEEHETAHGLGESGALAFERLDNTLLEKRPSTIMMHSTGVALFLYRLEALCEQYTTTEEKLNALHEYLPFVSQIIFARGNCDRHFFNTCDPAICQFIINQNITLVDLYSPKDDVLPASRVVTSVRALGRPHSTALHTLKLKFQAQHTRNSLSRKEKAQKGITPNGLHGFIVPPSLAQNFVQVETIGNHGYVLENFQEFVRSVSISRPHHI